jgi:cytochrome c biogenesis protein CcdA/glutaredoxin-related protein
MRYIKKILFLLILCILYIPSVFADVDKNLVNIYLFYSDSCPHCSAEKELLAEIEDEYDNVRIYKYEVSKNEDNVNMMLDIAKLFDTNVKGVPFTVIADKVYKGFNQEMSKSKFLGTIEYYSVHGYKDVVGEYLGNVELPSYEIGDTTDASEFINDYGNHTISFLGFKIDTKELTLPFVSVIIGLVDGFNPCAMWVLLFLISMLIGMKDKKRMWSLGLAFLFTSAFIYLLFMISWLNGASFLTSINWVRILIGLVALFGAVINLIGYIKNRKSSGCTVVNDKKRNKIFDRIKKFTREKNFWFALLGVVVLAISVNIVELACSAGLPVVFIEILSLNNLNVVEEIIYIGLYMIFFLLDDLIIFFIAMTTMQVTGFSTKYGKVSKLVGGILLLLMGVLLIFKPEWIMFNF